MDKKILGIVICVILFFGIVLVGVWYFNIGEEESILDDAETEVLEVEYQGTIIYAGMSFSEDLIDEEYAYSEVTSCAFDGVDKVYTYSGIEITVANVNDQDVIYSIYFIDDSVSTKEGIKISDSIDLVFSTYGEEYSMPIDNKYIYEYGDTELIFIESNDYISSIEYVLISE